MENKPQSVLVVFGEMAKPFQSEEGLKSHPNEIGPIANYTSVAAGHVAVNKEPQSQIWFVGGDVYNNGNQEAEQMAERMLDEFPHLERRTRVINNLLDTSYQAEKVAEEVLKLRKDAYISTIVPIEHHRRANGQLEAFGVTLDSKYIAHKEFVDDPYLSSAEVNARLELLRSIYFTRYAYIDLVREFGMNVIGKIDNKGLMIRKVSEQFRGDANMNGSQEVELFNSDLVTKPSPK